MLLWLWLRLAAAGLIGPLAWELPYATGAAIKIKKNVVQAKMCHLARRHSVHITGDTIEAGLCQFPVLPYPILAP